MSTLSLITQIILIVSFFAYGSSCFLSEHMVTEFKRYQLSGWRKFIGLSQILASLGLVVGFYWPVITTFSALGLAIQMLSGFVVRMRIGDPIMSALPAAIFFLLSLYLLIAGNFGTTPLN